MNAKFHPAMKAVNSDDLEKFKALVAEDPSPGTGLHYAALNGHRAMVEFLPEHGADRNLKDTTVDSTAAGWAEYGKHPELFDLLR